MIRLIDANRFAEIHRAQGTATRPPAAVNLAPVLELSGDLPVLEWDGETYRVRPLSYVEGLELQRIQLVLQGSEVTPAALDAREAAYDRAAALFWSFLEPKPEVNPFFSLLPEEVGALLGHFFACQTRRSARSRYRMAVHPSPSTT